MSNERGDIVDVINLYALAVDTQRWDLFDQVFTADVHADYPTGLMWRDLETFKRDFALIHDALDGTMHVMTNHKSALMAKQANSITYGPYRLIRHIPAGGGEFWEAGGWYDDHLINTPDGWRIKMRKARVCWWDGNPLVLAPLPNGAATQQARLSLRGETNAGRINYVKAVSRSGSPSH
jgi:hypothetical protein